MNIPTLVLKKVVATFNQTFVKHLLIILIFTSEALKASFSTTALNKAAEVDEFPSFELSRFYYLWSLIVDISELICSILQIFLWLLLLLLLYIL